MFAELSDFVNLNKHKHIAYFQSYQCNWNKEMIVCTYQKSAWNIGSANRYFYKFTTMSFSTIVFLQFLHPHQFFSSSFVSQCRPWKRTSLNGVVFVVKQIVHNFWISQQPLFNHHFNRKYEFCNCKERKKPAWRRNERRQTMYKLNGKHHLSPRKISLNHRINFIKRMIFFQFFLYSFNKFGLCIVVDVCICVFMIHCCRRQNKMIKLKSDNENISDDRMHRTKVYMYTKTHKLIH